MTGRTENPDLISRPAVEEFLYEEAARADAHNYAGWLELWAEDGRYFAPAGSEMAPDNLRVCLINEEYAAICNRVQILIEGFVHAQSPPHRLARSVTNVRVRIVEGGLIEARAIFNITAHRREKFDFFSGRVVYRLRPVGDTFRIVRKEVYLVNSDGFLPNMTFLL